MRLLAAAPPLVVAEDHTAELQALRAQIADLVAQHAVAEAEHNRQISYLREQFQKQVNDAEMAN